MRHMVTVLASVAVLAPARGAETWEQALREGDFIVDLRARYESVEQGGFESAADALTNRLRAGLQTAPLKGTAFLAEAVLVDDLVDDYNSTTNGQAQYPVVADPADFAAINRLALINKSLDKTTVASIVNTDAAAPAMSTPETAAPADAVKEPAAAAADQEG